MPYKEKHHLVIYNKAYQSGARRIVIAWLGQKCVKCGETKLSKLEISHIKPVKRQYRDYTDWLDKDNVQILCTKCNQGDENERRNSY